MDQKRKFIDIYPKTKKVTESKKEKEEIKPEETVIEKQEEVITQVPLSSISDSISEQIKEILEEEVEEKKEEWPLDLKPLKREFGSFQNRRRALKLGLLFILIGVISISFYLFSTVFAKTEIAIRRKRTVNEINQEILFDKNIKEINPEKLTLPVNFYVFTKEVSQSFQSSGFGKDERKATGEVTIYNKASYPQVLVANTRLETPDGKIFRINSRVTVPSATKENDKLIPGSISVSVTADQAGPDYNIGPCNESTNCKFTIVGFKGTEKYDLFYAYSDKEMTGGAFGTIPIILNEDLKKAEDAVLNEITKKIEEEIKNKISSDLKVIEGAVSGFKLVNLQSDAKAGDTRQFFNVSAKGERMVSAFNEKDVKDLLTQYYQKNIDENQTFCDDFELNYSLKEIDFNQGIMKVKVTGKYFLCQKIYASQIIDLIKGKPINEAIEIFNNFQGIEKAEIKTMPFWIKTIPLKSENISVNID